MGDHTIDGNDKFGFGKAAEAAGITIVIGLICAGLYFPDGINNWLSNQNREPDTITTVFNGQTSVCPKLDNHATTSPNTQVVVVGPNRYACPSIK